MEEAADSSGAVRSATESVERARETLGRLQNRLLKEPGGELTSTVEAVEAATALVDQLIELLERPAGEPEPGGPEMRNEA